MKDRLSHLVGYDIPLQYNNQSTEEETSYNRAFCRENIKNVLKHVSEDRQHVRLLLDSIYLLECLLFMFLFLCE